MSKPRNVGVMVVDMGGELKVLAQFTIKGHLEGESMPGGGSRVSARSRKKKQKELEKFLQTVEFPDDALTQIIK